MPYLSARSIDNEHVPDVGVLDGLRDVVALGNIIIFAEALDPSVYDGTLKNKLPELSEVTTAYLDFQHWFLANYQVEHTGDPLVTVFVAAAAGFASDVWARFKSIRISNPGVGNGIQAMQLQVALQIGFQIVAPEVQMDLESDLHFMLTKVVELASSGKRLLLFQSLLNFYNPHDS